MPQSHQACCVFIVLACSEALANKKFGGGRGWVSTGPGCWKDKSLMTTSPFLFLYGSLAGEESEGGASVCFSLESLISSVCCFCFSVISVCFTLLV